MHPDGADESPLTPASGYAVARAGSSSLAGPAKWVALGVVVGGSAIGLAWALQSSPPPRPSPPAPSVPQILGPTPVATQSAPADSPAKEAVPETTPAVRRLVNLNTATLAELDTLPGVGKVTAQAIVDYRTLHGPFRMLSELDKIKGIGPATIEKLRPLVTLDLPKPSSPA